MVLSWEHPLLFDKVDYLHNLDFLGWFCSDITPAAQATCMAVAARSVVTLFQLCNKLVVVRREVVGIVRNVCRSHKNVESLRVRRRILPAKYKICQFQAPCQPILVQQAQMASFYVHRTTRSRKTDSVLSTRLLRGRTSSCSKSCACWSPLAVKSLGDTGLCLP